MNEYEKIAAKLAEFAEKLELKGHTKIAEEVDDLNSKVIASFESMEFEKSIEPTTFFPVGFELKTTAGFETIDSLEQLRLKLDSNEASSINIIAGIKDALFAQDCIEGLATLKTASQDNALGTAISLAIRQGIIK